MNDELLIRLLEDTCRKLEKIKFPVETPHLAPTYNALLGAAKANHPGHPYLGFLELLPAEAQPGPEELSILFGQLRIVLEAITTGEGDAPGNGSTALTGPTRRPMELTPPSLPTPPGDR